MFTGSMVALVTPMMADGSVDRDALKQLVEWHIESGTSAIISVGTTGEAATLDHHEHTDVIGLTVEYSAGRIPVIAGTGSNATSEAIELTRAAQSVGASAALLVTPYYNKPTQEGLYLHYKTVAEACDLPQILYNVPGRTSCDMKPETVARLAPIDNIVGIKEATAEMPRLAQLIDSCPADFDVYSGDDATAMEYILGGAKANISVTANVAPAAMAQLCAAALAGDRAAAAKIDATLQPLGKSLFCESNPIPVKWALAEMGRCGHMLRLPLTKLADEYHAEVRDALAAAGIELTTS